MEPIRRAGHCYVLPESRLATPKGKVRGGDEKFKPHRFVDREFSGRYPQIVHFVPCCKEENRGNGYAGVCEESIEVPLAPTGSTRGRMGGVESRWDADRG